MNVPPVSLLRHSDFLKVWTGQTISLFGSQITFVALPLTATLTLGATPAEMGILGGAQFAPFLIFGLVAGAWVDRARRRPVLIAADIARAAILGSVPIALSLGMLTATYLYAVAFLSTSSAVFFNAAYQAYLPALVSTGQLVDGNSKLEASRSTARIVGTGLGGGLVQLITAPAAIAFDALSFLASAVCIWSVEADEANTEPSHEKRALWREVREGLEVVVGHPVLRSLALSTGVGNFFDSILFSVYVLYLTRDLGLDPTHIGLVFAVLGAGALVGSLACARATRHLGFGPVMTMAGLTMGVGYSMLPLAGLLSTTIPLVIIAAALLGLGSAIYNINLTSLRQAITPPHLLGRVSGTMQFLMWGTMPVGALLGGALGGLIGVQPTIIVGALGIQLAIISLLLSPVRTSTSFQ